MDPLSITLAAVTLGKTCLVITDGLRWLVTAPGSVDSDIQDLIQEVNGIAELCDTVQQTFRPDADAAASGTSSPVSPGSEASQTSTVTEKLWGKLHNTLEGCSITVSRLNDIILKIQRHPISSSSSSLGSKLDAVNKAFRKRMQESDLRNCRAQLATYQHALQVVLLAMVYRGIGKSRDQSYKSLRDLSSDIEKLDQSLQTQISSIRQSGNHDAHYDAAALRALEDLRDVVATAAEATKTASNNDYFDIPQSVSTIFTGREEFLEELRLLFIPPSTKTRKEFQRRFVIHGLGGSGKTQFCSKFAQDNRDSFWGVFWIDASTEERIKQTLGAIAGLAGREKNESAALHWLSNLDHRWLLIIDNADDESVQLERYFPKGNRGNILVTTRNQALTVHGNIGPGFYHFLGLPLSEATSLLLRASKQPKPWDAMCESWASRIADALGYLALAIVHAGAAIRDNLCSLRDYLPYYQRRLQRLLSVKIDNNTVSTDAAVFTTWEICFERLEGKGTEAALDALELLKVLAFLHFENISPHIFDRALDNPVKEAANEVENLLEARDTTPWSRTIRNLPLKLLIYLSAQSRGPPILPGVLRDAAAGLVEVDDAKDRVRHAFAELSRLSLVIRNEHNNTYSMHPLVHVWARERPRERLADGHRRQVRLIDKALFAEMTGRLISASILLPPLGVSEKDEEYHISLLPHIEHVQQHLTATTAGMETKRRKSSISAPTHSFYSWITSLAPSLAPDPVLLRMHAKFAFVYFKCGHFSRAESLLEPVVKTLTQSLGPQDPKTINASLFLSTVYWRLGRPVDAASLQESVLNSCKSHLGPSHPSTLRAMAELGKTRWQQGQYSAARDLQVAVLHDLTETRKLGMRHPEVLDAMDNLGLTVHKFWEEHDFEEAFRLHSHAAEGMAEVHGTHHERTLFAKENMCRVAVLLGEKKRLALAEEMMAEVLSVRRKRLGKEHPLTLLAMVNMAIVWSALGEFEEAERLISVGLPVAIQDFGEEHIGTLFGKQTLACVVAQRGRHAEAEALLRKVADAQKRMASQRGDYHPDRLASLIELARCCFTQGKVAEALENVDEAITGFVHITRSAKPHPLTVRLMEARKQMAKMMEADDEGSVGRHHVKFPWTVFRVGDD
ncbi:hypothetical protein QBC47DRAFT_342927 [Echria macrotheca]|uniref:NB-ARC domain-containing protein n=1 Tax=Echria macrotheca TaxID=438768 RepID=A0AAJ0BDD5_9PEZI|nr:hypothetical protein QBC47DRAFT_342927 [Echria macrotheca]